MWLIDNTMSVGDTKRSRFLKKAELLGKYPGEFRDRRNYLFLHQVPLEVEKDEGMLLLKKFGKELSKTDTPGVARVKQIEKDELAQKAARAAIEEDTSTAHDDVELMQRKELIQEAKALGLNADDYIMKKNVVIMGLIREARLNAVA